MPDARRWNLAAAGAISAVLVLGSDRWAGAYCDTSFGSRIGPPAMAQPDGTVQVVSGDCTGRPGCGDFFDIQLQAGDELYLSFCSNGGSASFDTDLSVHSGPTLDWRPVCATDECGTQAEALYVADQDDTYRVRIGHGELFEPLPNGTYTLVYSAPAGRVIVPSSCGDGSLDAGEQCDDGNSADGDCCSRTCTWEPVASECPDEGNDCTENLCDGAGTCTHPNKGLGAHCIDGEAFFCTADTCDGAGNCTHAELPDCNTLPTCAAPQPLGPVTFQHPVKGSKMTMSLVQAFVGCNTPDGNVPNATTESGTVPTCYPGETFDEHDGSPANGWHWGPYGRGTVMFAGRCRGAADFQIKLFLSGITDGAGVPMDGDGAMALSARLTLMDPMGGAMTTVDLPLAFSFHMANGEAKALTSLNAMLTDQSLPVLPNGVTFELAPVTPLDGGLFEIRDSNGNAFARPGLYLP